MPLLPLTTQNLILRELSPLDRIHYSLTSREAHSFVSSFHRQAYRIEHILLPFFDSKRLDQFRLIQLKTDTLISGSAAVQFFDLSVFSDADLDLYVTSDWEKVKLISNFLETAGYIYQPRRNQPISFQEAYEKRTVFDHYDDDYLYSSRSVCDVYSFLRVPDGRKIQIITSNHNTLQVILGFHSTIVMNVISYSHAYALYPFANFVERRSVAISSDSQPKTPWQRSSTQSAFDKYAARGWITDLVPSQANLLRPRSEFRDTARHVGDSACWVIPLNPVEHQDAQVVDSIRANSWFTVIPVRGQMHTRFKLTRLEILDGNYVHEYCYTSGADMYTPREHSEMFSRLGSIEDLIHRTHKVYDVEPDVTGRNILRTVFQACNTMPIMTDRFGDQTSLKAWSTVALVQELNIIFRSFPADPACSILFRMDKERRQLWTCVALKLPETLPARPLVSVLKKATGPYAMRRLIEYGVWVIFFNGKRDLGLWNKDAPRGIKPKYQEFFGS